MKSKLFTPKFNSRRAALALGKLYSLQSAQPNKGLTLVELLVSVVVGTIVLGIGFAGAVSNRDLFVQDVSFNTVNQNVSAAMDLAGLDIRQIGENIGTVATYPAVQVTNGGGTTSSEIIIRKNPLVSLRACENTTGGLPITVAMRVTFNSGDPDNFDPTDANNNDIDDEREANPTVAAALDASNQPNCRLTADLNSDGWPDDNLEKWRNYRRENVAAGITTKALVFNSAGTGSQDSFDYSAETGPTTTTFTLAGTGRTGRIVRYTISRSTGDWTDPTTIAGRSLYLVEERRYRLSGDTLQVIVNGGTPISLVKGLSSFRVNVNRRSDFVGNTSSQDFCWKSNDDATVALTSPISTPPANCGVNNQWNQIQSIDVAVSSTTAGVGTVQANRSLTKRFFPRSVFSF